MNDLNLVFNNNLELLRIIKSELINIKEPENIFKVLEKYLDNDEVMLVLGIGRNTFYNYKRYVKGKKPKDDDLQFNYIEKKLIKFRINLIYGKINELLI